MKKTALIFLTAYSIMIAGTATAADTAAASAPAAATSEQPQATASATAVPEECLKLVAAIKACEKIGGFSAMGCKYTAKSKYTCPVALDKLM